MFSSIFGKRRSSPVEDETPPIPGPKSDDSFVVVDPSSLRSGLYPSVSGGPSPVAPYVRQAPAPPVPQVKNADSTFHYLQGVPFSLSKELQLAANKDSFSTEVGDLLAFLTNKLFSVQTPKTTNQYVVRLSTKHPQDIPEIEFSQLTSTESDSVLVSETRVDWWYLEFEQKIAKDFGNLSHEMDFRKVTPESVQ